MEEFIQVPPIFHDLRNSVIDLSSALLLQIRNSDAVSKTTANAGSKIPIELIEFYKFT